MPNPPRDDDYKKWITISQHYGTPTRILDWTRSCLVALFFAVKDLDTNKDGVVWALNPNRYKNWFMNNDEMCKSEHETINGEIKVRLLPKRNIEAAFNEEDKGYTYPYMYFPYYIDERMKTQQSVFMVWGNEEMPLEKIEQTKIHTYNKSTRDEYLNNPLCFGVAWSNDEFLLKIIIDKSRKKDILMQLDLCGISIYSLFPTLDSLGKYIDDFYTFDALDVLDSL